MKKDKTKSTYFCIWGIITLAYAVWMIFFMKDTVLVSYETVQQRTVDGFLQGNITGMMGMHWLYPIWVAVSCLSLLAFMLYIDKILFAKELTKGISTFCLVLGVIGCVFVVWFGFFDVTKNDGTPAVFADKIKYITASMIGLEYPWHFRGWGVLGSASIFANTMYAYRKYNYSNRLAVILGSMGSAAIYMTINCPSVGEGKDFTVPRCTAHWAGALIFAVFCAAPIVLLMFNKARKEKGRFLLIFLVFAALLLVMLVLLFTVGKSAIIENIPMVAAYIVLFIMNFTKFFDKKAA